MKKNTPHDAMGQRIAKTVTNKNVTTGDKFETTYYVRDPQGNVLAVYEHKHGESGNGTFTLTEQHLYGASRLGMRKRDLALNTGNANESPANYYELTNHLGNVMAVISDEASTTDKPTIVSFSDYYPFGMTEPGRSWNAGDYRFGYTGHEKENDLAEGVYITEYRLLDTRLGRWLSVDPLWTDYIELSSYVYCAGNPMVFWDPDGREKIVSFPSAYHRRSELEGKTGTQQRDLIKERVDNATYLEPWARQYTRNIGVIHTFQHGIAGGGGVTYNKSDNTKGYITYVEDFEKEILNKSIIYKKNKALGKTSLLVMHSCQTGKEGGFAQALSEQRDLLVVAPSDDISLIPRNGKISDRVVNGGVYNIYYNGVLLESFNGSTKPLFDNPEKTIEKYKSMYEDYKSKQEEVLMMDYTLDEISVTPEN